MDEGEQLASRELIESTLETLAAQITGVPHERIEVFYKRRDRSVKRSLWSVSFAILRQGPYRIRLIWNIEPQGDKFREVWRMALKEIQQVLRPNWPIEIEPEAYGHAT